MGTKDRKIQIQEAISNFNQGSLFQNTIHLLKILGYESQKTYSLSPNSPQNFIETFDKSHKLDFQKALFNNWLSVDFIFQLTEDEFKSQNELFRTNKFNPEEYQSYLFLAIELKVDHYTRGNLVVITRKVNKIFHMPTMIFFKIGERITISVINRRPSKKDFSRDVLEKVTLIKDINTLKPHRAHIEILFDLSFEEINRKHTISNFLDLHKAWQGTLDNSELNKKFYKEVSNWYFWALKQVEFPGDAESKKEIRNPINVIRLITRLIFVWFLKEKGLVPDKLLNEKEMDNILNKIDKSGSTYYKAILQNLFFATLNTEMNKDKPDSRKFVERTGYHSQQHLMPAYRYERFFKSPDEAIKLFEDIPFLNGGLFENLDYEETVNGNRTIKRIDCFSDNPKNEILLKVPDKLFFGEERQVDLSKDYGDKKKRKETVKGIIHILNSYKFTVEENTPIEEEVALDPELLGKVFENLLASYNPETHTTARKQTGSFYTPREIVNYMVDESLIAYLENCLVDYYETQRSFVIVTPGSLVNIGGKIESLQMETTDKKVKLSEDQKNEINQQIRHLIAYNDLPHLFNEKEVDVLIKAIDNVKILDPACGSGAFPMGMLQKLVYVLSKLDPNNEKWKQKQIDKILEIEDSVIREKLIEDIEESFQNVELDYGRKLYLVENCIYGVDIQPIAVQIAKLRFFISLVIDQKINPNKKNLCIRPLPNLETKFIAANTLIGLDKPPQIKIRNLEIEKLEKQLNKVRQQHFNARTRNEKQRLREKDEQLRLKIADLLIDDGWDDKAASQIAFWDPYNQNKSSEFFEPEWMFWIGDGFDIVIGNPPYVDSETMTKDSPEFRNNLKSYFQSAKGNWDLFIVFVEKACDLTKIKGSLSYIVPNKLIGAKYSEHLRSLLLKTNFIEIRDYSEVQVFKESDIYPIVFMLQNKEPNSNVKMTKMSSIEDIKTCNIINKKFFYSDVYWDRYFAEKSTLNLILKISENKKCVEYFPLILGASTVSEAYEIKKVLKDKEYFDEEFKKFINTGTIDQYRSLWGKKQTRYINKLFDFPVITNSDLKKINPKRLSQANNEKIIIAGMSKIIEAFYDKGEYLAGKSTTIILGEPDDLKVLIAILNSRLISFWLKIFYNSLSMSGGYFNIGTNEISKIPIIMPTNKYILIQLVDTIINYENNNSHSNIIDLQNLLDLIVYKLYRLDYFEVKIVDPQFEMSEAEYNRLHFDFEDEISLESDQQRKQIA